jgi:hypothetical protein
MVMTPPSVSGARKCKRGLLGDIIAWSLIIFSIIAAIMICVAVYIDATTPDKNPCVMDHPRVPTSGYIQPAYSGVFTTTPQTHYLWYKGKWKLTGEACEKRRCVTENEYERQMYGH